MNVLSWVILITAIAGVCGTGLGGVAGAVLHRDSFKVISLLLAFAGGIMLAVVCFDLIPGSFRPEGSENDMPLTLIVAGVLIGYGVVYLLNYVIDRHTNSEIRHIDSDHPRTADSPDELIHADHLEHHLKNQSRGNRDLFIAGVVMAAAIALHNIPEGMVIGASYAGGGVSLTQGAGFIIAIVIGLHNIPEGMSVSTPLIAGGTKPGKAILITALSGAPTIIGALIGYSLGLISPMWLSLAQSFAGGAMLYVVFGELLPESFLMWKSKAPGVLTLIGMLVGIVLVRV